MEASDRYGSLVYEYRGMDYLRLAVFWSGDRLIDWENGSCGFEAVYSIDILAGRGHRRHPVKCGDLCGGAERLARRQLIKGIAAIGDQLAPHFPDMTAAQQLCRDIASYNVS